jgi:hypothetical protein
MTPHDTAHLHGCWVYNPHPSTHDTLVICPDGHGLLLEAQGTQAIRAFTWTCDADSRLRLTWAEPDDPEDAVEACRYAVEVYHAHDRHEQITLPITDDTTGTTTTQAYQLTIPPEKYLFIDLVAYGALDELWVYQRPAGNVEAERATLEAFAADFDLASALVGMNRDRETQARMDAAMKHMRNRLAVGDPAVFVHEPAPEPSSVLPSPFGANPWLKLLTILGTFGLAALLADVARGFIPDWLGIGILMVPMASFIFCWDPREHDGSLRRVARIVLYAGIYGYLALCAAGLFVIVLRHPRDWPFAAAFAACGIVPVVNRWRMMWETSGE